MHLDPYYIENSDPRLRCHWKSSDARNNTSGRYGTLGSKCDTPISLVQSTFEYLKKPQFQNMDFIIYTGDTARHDRDKKLRRNNSEVIEGHKAAMRYFNSTFDLSKTKLFPTIGNLDTFVHNGIQEASRDRLSNTLLQDLYEIWQPLNLDLQSTFQEGGYYAYDMPDGPTVISLNSMYFFGKNYDVEDCDKPDSPGAIQLVWLKAQLVKAQNNHRPVYIISHVPPIEREELYHPACYSAYVNILGDYSETLAGHFTGHTNDDTLSVLYKTPNSFALKALTSKSQLDFNPQDVINVLTNAPSIIPVNNPGFRIYRYDVKDGGLFGWDQYWADLDEGNADGEITWRKEYSSWITYGVDKLNKAGWQKLVHNLKKKKKTFSQYSTYVKVLRDK
ncbi:hypothetical protein NQZ79_g7775 [Umbelopsis isabellina]|nr:hypothetical protein NQZ79_g7775 [Umbelopsis isabellina]